VGQIVALTLHQAFDGQGALPRRGQHLFRFEDVGDVVASAHAAESGVCQHHGVDLTGGDLAMTGLFIASPWHVHQVAAQRHPMGRSSNFRPSRAHRASRGSSRSGIAVRTWPSAGVVGRSLSEWTAKSILPDMSSSRSALTNTPVPPSWVRWALLTSPKLVTSS